MSANETSRRTFRFRPRVESLEGRDVPAGNVTAVVQSGVLVLAGDDQANGVIVSYCGPKSVMVRALEGTTVNGLTTPQWFGDLSRGFDIRLNGGDDVALIDGVRAHRTLHVDMGEGIDELTLQNVQSQWDTSVFTGTGNDSLTVTGGNLKRRTAIDLGAGDDRVSIGRTKFGRDTYIVGGEGTDSRGIVQAQFHHRGAVLTGFESAFSALLPKAQNDTARVTVGQAATIPIAANDSPGTGTLNLASLTVVTQPTKGTVKANTDGTITYTSNANVSGADTFTYTILNAAGGTSNVATVTLILADDSTSPPPPPAPLTPVAANDAATVVAGQTVTIQAAANDQASAGSLNFNSLAVVSQPTGGTVVANADGSFTYTSTRTTAGTDSFTYTIQNTEGTTSNAATVNVTVTALPATPTATNDAVSVAAGQTIQIAATANDLPGSGTIDLTSLVVVNTPIGGTVVANTDGTFTYTSTASAAGSDLFRYTFRNSEGTTSSLGTVSITVTDGTSPPPVADTTPPQPTLATSVTNPTAGVPARFVATFGETVTGFELADITVSNGTVSNFIALNGFEYTFDVTPTSSVPTVVSVAAGVSQDLAGNLSLAASEVTLPSLNDPSWQTLASGVRIWDVTVGSGDIVPAGNAVANVYYTGWLAANGTVFDSRQQPSPPIPFNLPNGVIPGFAQGLVGMREGGVRRIFIPAALAYGANPPAGSDIPANADLVFEVELTLVS